METQIIYLAQRYTGREAEALAEALDYKWKLEAAGYTPDKGFVVFSPIINSAFEDWCKNPNFITALNNIFEGLNPDDTFDPTLDDTFDPTLVKFMQFIRSMDKVKANITPLDYLAYDCALIQGWLKYDVGCHAKGNEDPVKCLEFQFGCDKCEFWSNYDSGVLLAFCPSCFHYKSSTYTYIKEDPLLWDSKGAKTEYDFAKQNHVECVLVDSLFGQEKERI